MQPVEDLSVLETLDCDIASAIDVYEHAALALNDDVMKDLAAERIATNRRMHRNIGHRLQALAYDHHPLSPHDEPVIPESFPMALPPMDVASATTSIKTAEADIAKQLRLALTRHLTLETYAMLTDFLGAVEHQPTSAEIVFS